MQPINAVPRTGLLAQTIIDLLQNDAVLSIAYGAQWLDANLEVVGDVTEYMSEGSDVVMDSSAAIHTTGTILLDSTCPMNFTTDFIKPYMILSSPDTGLSATFYLGVYTLQTPDHDNSVSPALMTFTAYDLMYWLTQPVGDSVQAAVGANPIRTAIALIETAFPPAVVQFTDTTSVLSSAMVWPFDSGNSATTYLDIINQLLASAGYHELWVDWNGNFIIQPYASPGAQAIEWVFDLTAENNIVAEARTSNQDLFNVPNYWIFIMNNLQEAPVEGETQYTYVDNSPSNPGSYANRGRYIKKPMFIDAADYASLVAAATKQINEDLAPAETFSVTTSPFPLAWFEDQITLIDPNLEAIEPLLSTTRHTMALGWTLPLDGQSDMTWALQTVTQ